MSGGIELVVTDLDGTVWGRDGRIHPRVVDAFAELSARGITVLAATARRAAPVRSRFATHGLALPAVLLDGSLGHDFRSEETFHRAVFAPDHAASVLDILRDHSIEPCVYVDHPEVDVVVGSAPSTHPDHLEEVASALRCADLDDAVANEAVYSFLVCGRPREIFSLAAEALTVADVAVSVSRDVTFGGCTLSVRPQGISKWVGVMQYCATNDVDHSRVFAIGDGENDLELLKGAAVACAVDGASDAVMAAAHYRVGAPDVGGWADILDLIDAPL